jgi:hypothetical protein
MAVVNRLMMLLLVILLQGCMSGVYVMYPKDRPAVANPGMGGHSPKNAGDLPSDFHMFEYEMFRENGITSCSQLLARWGEPDSIRVNGNETILDYKYGFVWAGVAATIWLPTIPLGIPVGRKHIVVACKNDAIVSSTDTLTHLVGGTCVLWAGIQCGFGERPFYGPMSF